MQRDDYTMDRQQRTLKIVRCLNDFQLNRSSRNEFVSSVCDYFDYIKQEKLSEADRKFLLYLSSKAGIPHYYDILSKFQENESKIIDPKNIGLNSFSSLLYESSLFTDSNSKLHQYQKEILDQFKEEETNRYFLSASTSFGKTHLVYEIIKKMEYKNIVLIFPSIALLSENLSKIKNSTNEIIKSYNVHTLSNFELENKEHNIFIFTPERFLSFLDKTDNSIHIDFIFVDEVYKIDNSYIIEEEEKENERDIAYRMALFYAFYRYSQVDIFLAGPFIELFNQENPNYNPSFDLFLNDFSINKIMMNEYEIVKVNRQEIDSTDGISHFLGENIKGRNSKKYKLQKVLDKLIKSTDNTIVYCPTQYTAESVATSYERENIDISYFDSFMKHLKANYDHEWCVIQGLYKGVGIHHGGVPKYIQKEIINLFNESKSGVNILTSTTTITEGVNTTAKNVVVYSSKKSTKDLLSFDAKNIAGRAGRFMEHYSGEVISLDSKFIEMLESSGNQLTHKNYDEKREKTDIDIDITPPQYLDDRNKKIKEELNAIQLKLELPDYILSQFKVISKRDKMTVFQNIKSLTARSFFEINKFIQGINSPKMFLNKHGFQIILNVIRGIVDNESLKGVIEAEFEDRFDFPKRKYSILYLMLNSYIQGGYAGSYKYYLDRKMKKGQSKERAVNNAMRDTSRLVFNIFKYQLVKYLGAFNLMYKFFISSRAGTNFENTPGIDILLSKLEYNAYSDDARIASDYGVPQKIVDYFDAADMKKAETIRHTFDNYEKKIFIEIQKLIK